MSHPPIAEQFPFVVRDRCTKCHQVSSFIPFGKATLEEWIKHFEGLLPYVCDKCSNEGQENLTES